MDINPGSTLTQGLRRGIARLQQAGQAIARNTTGQPPQQMELGPGVGVSKQAAQAMAAIPDRGQIPNMIELNAARDQVQGVMQAYAIHQETIGALLDIKA